MESEWFYLVETCSQDAPVLMLLKPSQMRYLDGFTLVLSSKIDDTFTFEKGLPAYALKFEDVPSLMLQCH